MANVIHMEFYDSVALEMNSNNVEDGCVWSRQVCAGISGLSLNIQFSSCLPIFYVLRSIQYPRISNGVLNDASFHAPRKFII